MQQFVFSPWMLIFSCHWILRCLWLVTILILRTWALNWQQLALTLQVSSPLFIYISCDTLAYQIICTPSISTDSCLWGVQIGGRYVYIVYKVVDCSRAWLKTSTQLLAPGLVIGHFVLYVSGKCLTSELYMVRDNRGGGSTFVKHHILRSRKAKRTKQSH